MARLSSLAKKLTEQNGTEVETAVCEIFRNLGKERESVGQGCLVRTKQSNECCVVTADEVIPNGQLDTFEVEFTRGDSKLKRFFLKDIKKNVYYNSGLVIIVIDLESVKKQHKKNTWSMFTKSPLTVAALEESKKQISYFGKKRFNVIVSRNSTIKFPDHTPPTIPNGLVILQTASNSTDDDVFAIGIQSQVDGSQKIIWMNKILDSLFAPITAPDPSSMETPNPHTASTRTPANGDGQQSLVGAAADQPDNEPQNPVLNGGTAAGDVTDVSHTSSTDNEDRADYTTPATGDANHNSQRIEGASWLGRINGGFPEQENSPTNRSMKEESEHGATGGASDQQDVTVAENFEHYPGFKSRRRPSPTEVSYQSFQKPASTIPLRQIDNSGSQLVVTDGRGYRGSTLDNVTPLGKQQRHSYPYHAPKKEEQGNMKRSFSEATMKKRKIKPDDPLAKTILDHLGLLEGLSRCLDKEYKYGRSQCWKHIAEYFGIDEEMYQSFRCNKIPSPTEEMFDYLETTDTKVTIGKLKDKLRSIERQDVIDVLLECEKTDCSVNDDTFLDSLVYTNPDIIGRIAFLLDRQKMKNWVQLAGKLDIPKKVSKSFGTCNTDNPTEQLFEYLKTRFPEMTVEELITHLEAMQRPDVVKAIKGSTEDDVPAVADLGEGPKIKIRHMMIVICLLVKSVSFIKDLVKDVLLMDKLCELLNRKPGTNKVPWWKELGARLNIDTDILDDLSPPQDHECPTEALIRYLGSWRPGLKIADFIRALREIGRPDAIDVLKDYLPDGYVSEPL